MNVHPYPVIDRNTPVIVINLDRATERMDKMFKMLAEYGFSHVYRLSATENIVAPFLGCAQSHTRALRLARERGYSQVFIMEDDMEILLPPEEFWEKMRKVPEKFDVFHVVATVEECRILPGNELVKIHNAHNAAGYIVRQHYYDRLIENLAEGNSRLELTWDHYNYMNDRCWVTLQRMDSWYYFTQLIARQRQNEWSFISGAVVSNP